MSEDAGTSHVTRVPVAGGAFTYLALALQESVLHT